MAVCKKCGKEFEGAGMLIGDRIKKRRSKLGLSQSELGDKIGIDGSVISRWETNRTKVSQKNISKLAIGLKTSTDYLLGNSGDITPETEENISIGGDPLGGTENRLIIKKGDLYINLPETEEGFKALDRLLTSQLVGELSSVL